MRYGLKGMILGGIMLLAGSAWAIPMPDFILYGDAGSYQAVSAYWNDQKIATAELIEGHYKLVIPMNTESSYKSGDVVELWVNGIPSGQMELIGKVGEVRRLDF